MKLQGWQLRQRQQLPLEMKVRLSQERIKAWYEYWKGDVYVSFSGGKDSTALLDLVRDLYPKVPAVFFDTGLEYPEVRDFAINTENVTCVTPKMPFTQVIKTYGYPVVSKENAQKIAEIRTTNSEKLRNKRLYGDEKGNGKLAEKWKFLLDAPFKISAKCCEVMKKGPARRYEKESGRKPIVGLLASDSSYRAVSYLQHGCNSFSTNRPMSNPMGFWRTEDIWKYIKTRDLPYSCVYEQGYTMTGCMFCMFGIQKEEEPNRFQKMKRTHPKQYTYCMDRLGLAEVLDYMNIPY